MFRELAYESEVDCSNIDPSNESGDFDQLKSFKPYDELPKSWVNVPELIITGITSIQNAVPREILQNARQLGNLIRENINELSREQAAEPIRRLSSGIFREREAATRELAGMLQNPLTRTATAEAMCAVVDRSTNLEQILRINRVLTPILEERTSCLDGSGHTETRDGFGRLVRYGSASHGATITYVNNSPDSAVREISGRRTHIRFPEPEEAHGEFLIRRDDNGTYTLVTTYYGINGTERVFRQTGLAAPTRSAWSAISIGGMHGFGIPSSVDPRVRLGITPLPRPRNPHEK